MRITEVWHRRQLNTKPDSICTSKTGKRPLRQSGRPAKKSWSLLSRTMSYLNVISIWSVNTCNLCNELVHPLKTLRLSKWLWLILMRNRARSIWTYLWHPVTSTKIGFQADMRSSVTKSTQLTQTRPNTTCLEMKRTRMVTCTISIREDPVIAKRPTLSRCSNLIKKSSLQPITCSTLRTTLRAAQT